jgi:hypothetical protein
MKRNPFAIVTFSLAGLVFPAATVQASGVLPVPVDELRIEKTLISVDNPHDPSVGIHLTYRFSAFDSLTGQALPDSAVWVYENGNYAGRGGAPYTVTERVLRVPGDWSATQWVFSPAVTIRAQYYPDTPNLFPSEMPN